jgi:hypothetical protein
LALFKLIFKLIHFVNHFCRGWKIESLGGHNRLPNGILGVLTRLHYPGFVLLGEGDARREVVVTSFDHYALMPDVQDPTGRVFQNKAVRVVSEFWVCLPINKLCFLT